MKVLLNICGVGFIAKDAATAAVVADMLGHMRPVSREWLSTGPVLVFGRAWRSDLVEITEIGEANPMERKAFDVKKRAEVDAANAKAEGGGK